MKDKPHVGKQMLLFWASESEIESILDLNFTYKGIQYEESKHRSFNLLKGLSFPTSYALEVFQLIVLSCNIKPNSIRKRLAYTSLNANLVCSI